MDTGIDRRSGRDVKEWTDVLLNNMMRGIKRPGAVYHKVARRPKPSQYVGIGCSITLAAD